MWRNDRSRVPLDDRGPLRVLFAITSMPVGGAETLLANLVRGMDRSHFEPEICCLKERGPLGESVCDEFPVHALQVQSKWDLRVLSRLRHIIRSRRVDAMITVGAGDKMFWGRIAARAERVPVVCSALHSTGWPDKVGFLNRRLTRITDAFIAVATNHGKYLVQRERFPEDRVHVIPNGVDTLRFRPSANDRQGVRRELKVSLDAPLVGVVAALRPEKNLSLFLAAAARLSATVPTAQFLVVGDGPERATLEQSAKRLGLADRVHFLGTRSDIPRLLAAVDIFSLTSHVEANPVSILEALSCEVPVVATRVGSVSETVLPGQTGFLVDPGDCQGLADRWRELLADPHGRRSMGEAGRILVETRWSLKGMISGYERLIQEIYRRKSMQKGGENRVAKEYERAAAR